MKTAYSYLRYSRASQGKGDSFRRQLELANEWAAKRPDVQLDTTLRDAGVSGVYGQNRTEGALASFINDVRIGKVVAGSYLLIENFDRMSRESEMIAVNLLSSLTLAGITVVTLIDGREYDRKSKADDLTRALYAINLAHDEVQRRAEKVRKAWAQKKIAAREEGKPVSRRGPAWLTFDDTIKAFVPIASRVAVIERIFKDYSSGLGLSTIAKRLNAEGIPPFSDGVGWHVGYLGDLIRKPTVLGHYQPLNVRKCEDYTLSREPDGELIKNYYPAVISDELYYAAQRHRERASNANRKGPPRGRRGLTNPNTMMGLARCETCGGTLLVLRQQDKAKTRAFVCYSRSRGGGCSNNVRYRVHQAEALLFSAIASAKAANDRTTAVEETAYHEINSVTSRLAEAKKENQNATTAIKAGHMASVKLGLELEAEIAELSTKLERLTSELNRTTIPQSEIVAAVEWLRNAVSVEARAQAGDADAIQELYDRRAKMNAILRELYDWIIPVNSEKNATGISDVTEVLVGKGKTVTLFEEADFDVWSPAAIQSNAKTRMRTTLELDEPIEKPTAAILIPMIRAKGRQVIDALG